MLPRSPHLLAIVGRCLLRFRRLDASPPLASPPLALIRGGPHRALGCRQLCSKTTAGRAVKFPPEGPTEIGEAAVSEDKEDLLDYDEYVEYLGEDETQHPELTPAARAEASAERRRRFIAECPVDALRCGRTGVLDVDELVRLLRHQNARDIVAVATAAAPAASAAKAAVRPPCIVVCTGRSSRHLLGLAEYILRVLKSRLLAADSRGQPPAIPLVEAGANPSRCSWVAIDLGNCGLHCFLPEARAQYDLEALWCLGPALDPSCLAAAASRPAAPSDAIDWEEVARLAAAEKEQARAK